MVPVCGHVHACTHVRLHYLPWLRSKPALIALVTSGKVHPRPDGCSDAVYAVLAKCWCFDPLERPGFGELRDFFQSARPAVLLAAPTGGVFLEGGARNQYTTVEGGGGDEYAARHPPPVPHSSLVGDGMTRNRPSQHPDGLLVDYGMNVSVDDTVRMLAHAASTYTADTPGADGTRAAAADVDVAQNQSSTRRTQLNNATGAASHARSTHDAVRRGSERKSYGWVKPPDVISIYEPMGRPDLIRNNTTPPLVDGADGEFAPLPQTYVESTV